MDHLIKDNYQNIILELDWNNLKQLFICNKQWYQILSDQQIWTKLLICHFQAQPLPKLNACQSYQFYHYWPRRVEWITYSCQKTAKTIYSYLFSSSNKTYFRQAILTSGPKNYTNIEIVW